MKKLFTLIILAALGGGGYWYYLSQKAPEAPEYQTIEVTKGNLTQIVTATGTLNAVVNVQVGSQISGYIQKLFADFNSPVTKGQIVAQLDPSIFQAIVHQMNGDLASAKAGLELAKLNAQRKESLVAQNAAPKADLDTARATLDQADALVKVKEANLEKAKVDLDHCTIYSPIDGTVISRSVDVGQTVAATMNAPVLFTVANDLAKMQIDSNVAEADVGSVEMGQPVDFTVDAYPYRVFKGKVAQVRNAATTVQNVVTYDVVIAVDNADLKLKPGMTANVAIVVAEREDVIKVPNAALRFKPQESTDSKPVATGNETKKGGGGKPNPRMSGAASRDRKLYVLRDKVVVPIQVKLGINDGVSTEIVEGLNVGEAVITGQTISANKPATASSPFGGGGRRF